MADSKAKASFRTPKLVQFGAGRIGRSFLGQLFGAAGYEVVFVEADPALVEALNARRGYTIIVQDTPPGRIDVANVRAVNARDRDSVADEIADADIIATSVGKDIVPLILPTIAQGLLKRREAGRGGIDIILAENLREAADVVRTGLRGLLPDGFPIEEYVGLVETSIGKMCPIMPEEIVRKDPTEVWCEAYNTLICDRRGFLHGVPDVPGLDPKDNIRAYVDRKAFIHNLGHATCAYMAYQIEPVFDYIEQALHHPEVRSATRAAMGEAATALRMEYPDEFTPESLDAHIRDLLHRFGNEALKDSVHRVGRDLPRKLARDDRMIGGLLLCAKHGVPSPSIVTAIACGLLFRKRDMDGSMYPADEVFASQLESEGVEAVLSSICDLREPQLREAILEEYGIWSSRARYEGGRKAGIDR